jgi:ABC-type glutathione transport system ATPase component
MEYFRKSGKTVLFVSHDPQLVQMFCSRALWLEGGKVAMCGNAHDVVTAYQAFCRRLEDERLKEAAQFGEFVQLRARKSFAACTSLGPAGATAGSGSPKSKWSTPGVSGRGLWEW